MSREVMPIMSGKLLKAIPWAMIAPHEPQAISNHSQSLERLAQRGGYSVHLRQLVHSGAAWRGNPFGIHSQKMALQDQPTPPKESILPRGLTLSLTITIIPTIRLTVRT